MKEKATKEEPKSRYVATKLEIYQPKELKVPTVVQVAPEKPEVDKGKK